MTDLTCRPNAGLQGSDHCSQPVCLSPGQIVGLSFTAQAGFISAIAVLILLIIVMYKYRQWVKDPSNPSRRLIRTNIDGFMLNLLIADLLMSVGAILDVKWASEGKTYCGTYCNAQGAIQILGETAVALFTLSITLLSFISVFRGRAIRHRLLLWGGVSAAIWVFVLLWAVLGYTTATGEPFYAPTPYWCWISKKYKAQRLGAEYVWLWIAGFGSIFLYIPLFLVLRGNVAWDPALGWRSIKWRWSLFGLPDNSETSFAEHKDVVSVRSTSGGMSPATLLWYPLAYTILVLPVSIVRWITFNNEGDPTPQITTATFVVVSIFNLSGLVNVVLILFTRTNVLFLGSHPTNDQTKSGPSAQFRGRTNGAIDRESLGQQSHHAGDLTIFDPLNAPIDEAKAETGFGGPRVRLRDDSSDFGDGWMNRNQGASTSGPLAPAPVQLQHNNASVLAHLPDQGEAKAPGRAYLESLGYVRKT